MSTPHPVLAALVHSAVHPSPAEWEAFLAATRTSSFGKGEVLVDSGGPCPELHLVTEGVCRHFFLDPLGNEITSWFSEPGMLATDYRGFTEGVPSLFTVQALTPLTCISIRRERLQALYDGSKTWERLGRIINQHYLNQLIDRNTGMFTRTAPSRYAEFAATRGHLLEVAQLKHIASYLGMTLETLSRIRSGNY